MNEADILLKEQLENNNVISYDVEKEKYMIELTDPMEVVDAYVSYPAVRTFIEMEILVRRKNIHEQEYKNINRYEVLGYAYENIGESYTVSHEWLKDAEEWIQSEF